jgi:hypothetical protein
MTDIDWDSFQAGLAETLATLPEQAVLIIRNRPRPWHFVQFALGDDRLRAEVSSGTDELDRVNSTDEELAVFLAAGWEEPPDPRDNHGVTLPWPAPSAGYARVAAMAVTALRDAYGVGTPATLGYEAWSNGDGRSLTMPKLGLGPAVDRRA